jgi:23S rRNA pseudouridine1911/1915/1917 synthase
MSGTPKKSESAIETRIDLDAAGTRIDRWLATRAGRSRSQAHALLEAGLVQLDGRTLSRSDKGLALAAGQRIEVHTTELLPEPSDAPLTIAAHGHDWLIADKPAGLPVHPLNHDQRDTLLNRVVAHRPAIVGVGEGGLQSGVVHRLDVPTSGLVLFALSDHRYHAARKAFSNHTADKRYFALVHGRVTQPRRVELDLVVAQHRPARVAVVPPGEATPRRAVRRCALSYKPLEHGPACTLLDVQLETGFLHQIRVTLAHLGHLVLGDDTYAAVDQPDAAKDPPPSCPRLMLHAHTLSVTDAAAKTALPIEFRNALDAPHP